VAATIMNGMTPRRFWAEDASVLGRVETDDPAIDEAVRAALRSDHHARIEHEHLRELTVGTYTSPIVVPDLGPIVIGQSELSILADALDGTARTAHPAARP
jgi:hypothetical protein